MSHLFKILSFFILTIMLYATPNFPKLTGRVVDNANILSVSTKNKLDLMLANLKQNNSNQLVVVTLKSLQGYDISDFGYQLGRYWGIGQKSQNNGALLIVEPNERKVRIEVGYGLEGDLTDAISSAIIQNTILPYFKKSDFNGGILSGVKAIIDVIKGTYEPIIKKHKKASPNAAPLFFGLFFILMVLERTVPKKYRGIAKNMMPSGFAGIYAYLISVSVIIGICVAVFVFLFFTFTKASNKYGDSMVPDWYSSNDSFSGGSGSFAGGFSGGGGSFGGGGASGGW